MGTARKRSLIQVTRLGLLLFCLLCHAGPAVSKEHRVMFTSVSTDMEQGPNTILLKAVARELGLEIRFRLAPFKRRLIMMKNGDLDLICGLLFRPEREAYICYITPPYKTRSDTLFFVRTDRAGQIQSYRDLRGLKIGVSRGAGYFLRFDRDTTLIKEPAQPINNFNKLLLGRLDTVIQSEASGFFLMHSMGVTDKITISPYRFSLENKVYFGISRKSRMMDSLDRIQPVLEGFIRSGRARAILTGYYTSRGLPVPVMWSLPQSPG